MDRRYMLITEKLAGFIGSEQLRPWPAQKILVIAPVCPHPEESGSQIRLYHLCRYLHAEYTVHIACCAADVDRYRPEEAADICHRFIPLPPSPASWPRRLMRVAVMHPFTPSASVVRGLRKLAEEEQYSVVIAAKTIGGFYALESGLNDKAFIVLEEGAGVHHLYYRRQYEQASATPDKLRALVRWRKMLAYERRLVCSVPLTVSVSARERVIIEHMTGPDKVILIPNGVDVDHFRPAALPPAGPRTSVVFMGSYTYEPNIKAARFAAHSILPALDPRISLVIAGKSPPADLLAMATTESRLQVPGFVKDIRPLLHQAFAVVNPMWEGGGTRLKVLHAMAMGCPVISTAIGAEGIEYTPGKNILLAETSADFARHVLRLFQDCAYAEAIGQEGRRLVEEKYNWQHIMADFGRELSARLRRPASRRD